MVKWIGLVLIIPKACDNHRQRDKQIEKIEKRTFKNSKKLVMPWD